MKRLIAFVVAALGAAILFATGMAAPGDVGTAPSEEPRLELIVIEARRNCPLCQLFRDEIVPAYALSRRAARAPLRFVDVDATDPASLRLAAPVEIMPTIILMRDGAEVDRIVGYTGPELFMHAVGVMLGDIPAGPMYPESRQGTR